MEDYDSSEDLDDDWFYESVMRYNTLQMFYLQNVPEHVLQIDEFTICIASRNEKSKFMELMELQLPKKLTLSAEEEGRSKENDFKILSGIYVDKPIYQMGLMRDERRIVTSQMNKKGLQLYNFCGTDTDSIKKCEPIAPVEWVTPNFAVDGERKTIICSKCHHKPLVIFDVNSGQVIREITIPGLVTFLNNDCGNSSCSQNNIKCQLLNEDLLAVLDIHTGVISLIDLRTRNLVLELGQEQDRNNTEYWTLSEYDFRTNSNYFGALSKKGNLFLYDVRKSNDKCADIECFNAEVKNYIFLKLKIANDHRLSISGLDSNVYVYNILKNSVELVFTHNGHLQKGCNSKDGNLVNDHIWLPSVGTNFVLSIAGNRSLHCWEYG